MAQVLTNCFISLDGQEYSGQGTSVAISYGAEAVDITTFELGTDAPWRENTGGVREWSMSFEFVADESANGQAFFDMVGTVVPVEVRPASGERGPANPGYRGSALVTDFTPLSGSVGDAHSVSLSIVSAGPLTRDIDPLSA